MSDIYKILRTLNSLKALANGKLWMRVQNIFIGRGVGRMWRR